MNRPRRSPCQVAGGSGRLEQQLHTGFHMMHLTVDSLDKALRKNADGSVDIYVGSEAPAGMEPTGLRPHLGRIGIHSFDSTA